MLNIYDVAAHQISHINLWILNAYQNFNAQIYGAYITTLHYFSMPWKQYLSPVFFLTIVRANCHRLSYLKSGTHFLWINLPTWSSSGVDSLLHSLQKEKKEIKVERRERKREIILIRLPDYGSTLMGSFNYLPPSPN